MKYYFINDVSSIILGMPEKCRLYNKTNQKEDGSKGEKETLLTHPPESPLMKIQ